MCVWCVVSHSTSVSSAAVMRWMLTQCSVDRCRQFTCSVSHLPLHRWQHCIGLDRATRYIFSCSMQLNMNLLFERFFWLFVVVYFHEICCITVVCWQSQFRFENELGTLLSEPAKRVRYIVIITSLVVNCLTLYIEV